MDNSFYKQILMRRGILEIDQNLAEDRLSKSTVQAIASSSDFNTKFGQAMVKMSGIQVLTGNQGEIRRKCNAVNPKQIATTLPSLFNWLKSSTGIWIFFNAIVTHGVKFCYLTFLF